MKTATRIAAGTIAALIVLYACGIIPPARGQVTSDVLTWERPTTRADGSPLAASEILQYRIDWGTVAGGPYTAGSVTAPGSALTFTRSSRTAGRACYVMVTVDTAGLISANSNEGCTEKCPLGQRVNAAGSCIALALPGRPLNLQAT